MANEWRQYEIPVFGTCEAALRSELFSTKLSSFSPRASTLSIVLCWNKQQIVHKHGEERKIENLIRSILDIRSKNQQRFSKKNLKFQIEGSIANNGENLDCGIVKAYTAQEN